MRHIERGGGSVFLPSQSSTLGIVADTLILQGAVERGFRSSPTFADQLDGPRQGMGPVFHRKRALDNFDAIDVVQTYLSQIDVSP